MNSPRNRLEHELSPYLQQHAQNPVNWFPWGDEAFARAREEDKPIFLSIGYSTCHWCHVMGRESFSDAGVADLLNEYFICIKVDREERPDIDSLYMNAAIALTGSGGWPLNMVLTPDLHPFYAATYLPREGTRGIPGLLDILPALAKYWAENRDAAVMSAGRLAKLLSGIGGDRPAGKVMEDAADRMVRELARLFDGPNGGFGPAPKFPMPHIHLFLLRYWKWTGDERARSMAEKTLTSMARGGIYDQVGRGFHRYSTDNRWLVPHFEKMLYDQALAAMAYTEAFLAGGNPEYAGIACGCMDYVSTSLSSPWGGFYSAEDADSEGEEGKYYLWTFDEIASLLDPDDARVALLVYSVSKKGNFPGTAPGKYTGQNILHRTHTVEDAARILSMDRDEVRGSLERIRSRLLVQRESRHKPFRDEKILTDWNGLAIASLAVVSRAFRQEKYLAAAAKAAAFILSRMRMEDGGLYHRFRDGVAGIPATSGGYAGLIYGLLELYFASGDPRHLDSALALEEYHEAHFWDRESGGYYTTGRGAKDVFSRQKEFTDGAIPSPNSLSYCNLVRLALLTGDDMFSRRADMVSRYYSPLLAQSPSSCGMFMAGFTLSAAPADRVLVMGKGYDPVFGEMRALLNSHYLPFALPVFWETEDDLHRMLPRIVPSIREYPSKGGRTTAYACSMTSCKPPVHTAGGLAKHLGISGTGGAGT